jgi:hypothetical protein
MTTPRKLALILSVCAALLPAQAQVTNIIYQDNFARVGPLDGSAPDIVNTPGATWLAANNPALKLCLVRCSRERTIGPPFGWNSAAASLRAASRTSAE